MGCLFPLKACKMSSGITKASPQGGGYWVRAVGTMFPKYFNHHEVETSTCYYFGQSEKEKGKLVFSLLAPSFSVFYLNVFFFLITFRHLLKFQFILTSVTSCWSSPSGNFTVEDTSLYLCHFHCLPLCVALPLFPVSPNTSAILLVPETGNSYYFLFSLHTRSLTSLFITSQGIVSLLLTYHGRLYRWLCFYLALVIYVSLFHHDVVQTVV